MPGRRQKEPDLLSEVEESLRDPHPIRLLGLASALLAATEPESHHPLDEGRDPRNQVDLTALMDGFLGSGDPSFLNLVAVMARLQPDQLLRARLMRSVDSTQLVPWVRNLGEMAVTAVCMTVDRLRDTANVVLECRLAEHVLCLVVLVDFNQGGMAKDGFIIDGQLSAYQQLWGELETSGATEMLEVSPADARVELTDAIDLGAMAWPPYESESWPQARPLARWVLDRCPTGGVAVDRPEWSDSDREDLGADFLSSTWGRPYATDHDAWALLDALIDFGADQTFGDPLLISPVNVEVILMSWAPEALSAPQSTLALLPDLLSAYVAFAHDRAGASAADTQETLDLLRRSTPDYRRLIDGRSGSRAAASLPPGLILEEDIDAMYVEWLASEVGGHDQLEALDADPLPDEALELEGVPTDVVDRVRRISALCDGLCDALLDVETRTATRRLIRDVAIGDPRLFRRKSRDDLAAAALCWLVGSANRTVGWSNGIQTKVLMAHFGLTGSPSQRAESSRAALGLHPGVEGLGSPRYLTSASRAALMEARDFHGRDF